MRKILSTLLVAVALLAGYSYSADEVFVRKVIRGQTNTTMSVGLTKLDTSASFSPYGLGYPNPRSGKRSGYGSERGWRVAADSLMFIFHGVTNSTVGTDTVGFVPHFIGRSELPQTPGTFSEWHAVYTPTDTTEIVVTDAQNVVSYYTFGLLRTMATTVAGTNTVGWPDEMAVILRTTVHDTSNIRMKVIGLKYEP